MITNKRVEEQEFPQPLVSVIIPSYNREKLIGETLDSVLAQTYQHWECIVVDDGSTDGTLEVVRKYANGDNRIKLYTRDREPKGACTCRNIGFDKSNGDYIQFFDSDDIMHEDLLSIKVHTFLINPDADLVVCRFSFFPEKTDFISFLPKNESEDYLKSYLLKTVHLNTPNSLFRRTILIASGLFNSSLSKAQEVELYSRVLSKTNKIIWLRDVLIFTRLHAESITQSYYNNTPFVLIGNIESRLLVYKNLSQSKYKIDIELHTYVTRLVFIDLWKLLYARQYTIYRKTLIKVLRSEIVIKSKWSLIKTMFWTLVFILTRRLSYITYKAYCAVI